jgi:hypothetical protein
MGKRCPTQNIKWTMEQWNNGNVFMIMIPWKSVLKYLNCLKLTKDEKKLNFEDFVEKNTGIQTYVYKIRWENDVPHKILNGQWNNGTMVMYL